MTIPSRRGVLAVALPGLLSPLLLATPAHASETANEIVYTADDNNDGIYSVVLRDLESRRVSTVLPADTTNEWFYDDPELSSDGSRVVFSTDRGGTNGDEGIAVVNRDGTGFARLTNPGSVDVLDVGAAWSPDGSRVLFTRIAVTTDSTGKEQVDTSLMIVPVTGGGAPTALVGAEDGYTGDWSPDGRSVVFAALPAPTAEVPRPDTGPLQVVNSDGTNGRRALGPIGIMPAWSPDGSTIAYSTITERDSDRTRGEDVAQIATVPAAGGSQRVLAPSRPTSARTIAEYPAWSPDGESIVYDVFGYSATEAFPPGDLWAVDRAGVRAGRVTATAGDEAQAHVQGPSPASVAAGTASTYVPVTPQRVLDTREGVGAAQAKVEAGRSIDLAVRGLQTSPSAVPADATAVVLNVTVTGTTAGTDVRVFPSGSSLPNASNINAGAGQTVPNLVTVAIGSNGAVTLYNSGGSVNLIADVAGYYVPGTAGLGFAALTPTRIADTRRGVGCISNKIRPGAFCDLQITGIASVPADARAVVLNVTATGATAGTDVRVYPVPADASVPEVSNLNLRAGQTVPNLVTVAIGEGGKVRMRNAAGQVDLIADIAGYYAPGASGRFVPVTPSRFLDTRSGVGTAPIPVTGEGFVDIRVAGARGVPVEATAAVLNLTGTGVTSSTDVRAYPVGVSAVPEVSNLNLTRGTTRANAAIVKTGTDGRIRVRNAAGQLNLIGDLAGYMVG